MANKKRGMYSRVYEKDNILDILKKTKVAITSKDTYSLKKLSDRTIHNASHYQDTDSLTVAVLIYAIGKIVERSKYQGYKDWPTFEKSMVKHIDSAVYHLSNDQVEDYRADLNAIRTEIHRLSGHLKKYVEEVFRKASVNKASRIYEHGISMEQTASLLGITMFELAEYTGKTGIADVNLGITMPIKKRLKIAEEILG